MNAMHSDFRHVEREEYRWASFCFAVLVHVGLAALLLISVQWRTQRVETIQVEMWGGLPPPPVTDAVPVPPVPVVERVEPPLPAIKPEIVEKKIEPTTRPQPTPKKEEAPSLNDLLNKAMTAAQNRPTGKPKVVVPLKTVASGVGGNHAATSTINTASGSGSRPNREYTDLVMRIIQSHLAYHNRRGDNPKARIRVTVLPDGSVQDVEALKTQGDPAYAEAAKRAVRNAQRLPAQPDGKPFSGDWRVWIFNFCADPNSECKID